jgi:uncharacterized membrane protein YphA (DoxX/SURF4 family)
MIGVFLSRGLPFKLAFVVAYFAVIWVCLEAVRIPELRNLIKQGYETTMRLTTMVVFILIGSTCFSIVFLGVSGGVWLEHMLTSLPGGVWGFLAAASEFFGGLALVFGGLTRPAAFFLVCTMIVATVQHYGRGDGYSGGAFHSIEMGLVCLSLLIMGPGKYSLDEKRAARKP